MKSILRHYVIETLSLFLVSKAFLGIVFENGYQTLLLAGVVLMVSTIVIKPIINILILPINLVTFGFFKWISSVAALYIVTLAVSGFKITGFAFNGLASKWIDLPSFSVDGIFAYVLFSFAISLIASIVHWFLK